MTETYEPDCEPAFCATCQDWVRITDESTEYATFSDGEQAFWVESYSCGHQRSAQLARRTDSGYAV